MPNPNPNELHATIRIQGMHCGSCEILLERKLKALQGIKHVSINHRTGVAKLVADAANVPSPEEIETVVTKAGYGIADDDTSDSPSQCAVAEPKQGVLLLRMGGLPAKDEQQLRHKLKGVPGIRHTSVADTPGPFALKLYYRSPPDHRVIEQVVRSEGFSFISLEHTTDAKPARVEQEEPQYKWMEIGASLLIIFALWKIVSAFDLISLAPSTSGALSFGGILLIGIIAGTSSCLAVTGGLLLAAAAKYNEVNQSLTKWQKFKPLLQFNIGRLVSYFLLGGLVGVIGKSITLSTRTTGYLNIGVALVMLYIALTILKLIPKGSFGIKPPKALSHWIHDLAEHDHPLAPMALGALTFFLPCGFTQSLQLVALASGSFWTGAMTMFVFALGTLPALLGVSALSSATSGTGSRLFLRFTGTLVLILALFNLNSALALTGFDVAGAFSSLTPASSGTTASNAGTVQAAPAVANGVQEVSMAVSPSGYDPSVLTVKAGVPVKWIVDGTNARGCISTLVIPSLNVYRALESGPNIIEFTPTDKGRLLFSCSMGMYRGYFDVI